MVRRERALHGLLILPVLLFAVLGVPVDAQANGGLHLGWCIGVGNRHHSSSCTSTNQPAPDHQGTANVPVTGPGTNSETGGSPLQLLPGALLGPTKGKLKEPDYPVPYPTPYPIPNQVPQAVPTPVPVAVPPRVPPLRTYPVPNSVPGRVPQAVPTPVPAAVPPRVPPLRPYPVPNAVPGRVPQAVPTSVPAAVPPRVPQLQTQQKPALVPYPVPYPRPIAIPVKAPPRIPTRIRNPVPYPVPAAKPVAIPGKVPPLRAAVVHVPVPVRDRDHHKLVTPKPGRQAAHNIPRFADAKGGGHVDCAASGLHRRRHLLANGMVQVRGILPEVDVNDPVARDVPARRLVTTECLVKIKRRKQPSNR